MLCSPNSDWLPPPTLFYSSPSPPSFLLSVHYGPKPAKHICKWQLLRLSSKKPQVVGFPCLMWHLWPCKRVGGVGGALGGTMAVCLRDGREGVKNQNVKDISSQQIDTGPLIPSFFFPSSWTWSALQMAILSHWSFLESEKTWEEGFEGKIGGFPQHTHPLDSITSQPSKKKKSTALFLLEFQPVSQDPTTAASAVSHGFSSLRRKAQQAHCSAGRRLGQLCLS